MELDKEGLSCIKTMGLFQGATEKARKGGRSRVGPPGAPRPRVGMGMTNGDRGSKERGHCKSIMCI